MKTPIISVIVPTYHRNDLLAKCLDALAPGAQTLAASEYEVIVTDDGKRMSAQQMMAEKYPWAKWVEGPHKGPAANRNNGARHASGEWIAFTDDDCEPRPQWLEELVKHTTDSGIDVLEGRTITEEVSKGLFFIAPVNEKGGYLWSCNMAVKRPAFEAMNGFDEDMPHPHLEDVDFRLRLKNSGRKSIFIPAAVVFHAQRPAREIMAQIKSHESGIYLMRKHGLPLKFFGLHPVSYATIQLRIAVKASRNPMEGLRFLLTRSLVEGACLLVLIPMWCRKYPPRGAAPQR